MDDNIGYLEMKGIGKCFGSVAVLSNTNLSVRKGEVLGLLGGNGAGKSTLMNILGGIIPKDGGQILIDGKEVEINNPNDSMKNGIAFIHQELKLFSMRSIAENIYMSRLPTKGLLKFVDEKKINEDAKIWLDLVKLNKDPRTPINELSIAERQMVEIAKALSRKSRIIIFDEPTSSLTSKETKLLFEIINELRDSGVSIIFISHKFDEIFEICDRVTVIRNGVDVATVKVSETDTDELVSLMIGIKLNQYYPPIEVTDSEENILELENLMNNRLDGVSISVKKGEILGLFGLVGAGRSELCRAIFGLDPLNKGEVLLEGKAIKKLSPKTAMKAGISFLTEDRKLEGLIMDMDIISNLNLPILPRLTLPVIGCYKGLDARKNCINAFRSYGIVAKGPTQRVRYLSGGNQQKVVLSKWFLTNSKVYLLDEPTRGVDVKAKADIYNMINMLAKKGASVIVVSSEAPELLGICHRILVMRDGRIVGEVSHSDAKEEELVKLAVGGGE